MRVEALRLAQFVFAKLHGSEDPLSCDLIRRVHWHFDGEKARVRDGQELIVV